MDKKNVLICLLLVLAAVVSMLPVANWATRPGTYEKTIDSIDRNIATVLRLTAASTAASAGISMIPDDTATPIANKLADFSEYFLLILCVLYAEKYLMTLIGALAFRFVIPAACLGFAAGIMTHSAFLHKVACKFILFAIAASLAVPLSIMASDTIYNTYEQNMEQVIASAEEFTEQTEQLSQADGDKGLIASILQTMSETVSSLLAKASALINYFLELLAVMIVTSCLIPVLVLVFFIWLIKVLTGVQIPIRPRRAVSA